MNIFRKISAAKQKKQKREEELKRVHEVALMACMEEWSSDRHNQAIILMELDQVGIGLPGFDR